jgi:hypothetical protein
MAKLMSNIDVKQGCFLSSTLLSMYIDELEKYLDEISGDSPCSFDITVVILLYANDVVLLSKLGSSLRRLLNQLHEFFTSSSLEVNLSKTKIMIFGHNKRY